MADTDPKAREAERLESAKDALSSSASRVSALWKEVLLQKHESPPPEQSAPAARRSGVLRVLAGWLRKLAAALEASR